MSVVTSKPTWQMNTVTTVRSTRGDLTAYQEIWAYLIVHHAINALTARASAAADIDPDSISFTRALRLIRCTATGTADIPPCGPG